MASRTDPTNGQPGANSTSGSNKATGQAANPKKHSDAKRVQPKFDGRIPERKGMTYDIVGYKRQDDFDKTTKEAVGYLKRKDAKYAYNAAEYIRLMVVLDESSIHLEERFD